MKFSIIVPVYNVAPYLRDCLDSIVAQSVDDWECICVDDGSTDESGKIVDEYAGRDKRFRVVHKANGGLSSARNAAFSMMRGDWVVLVDSDDILACDWLKAIDLAAQGTNADWIRLGCTWWWPEKVARPNLDVKVPSDVPLQVSTPAELLRTLQGQAMPFMHVYRRSTIGSHVFCDDVRLLEDEINLLEMQEFVTAACTVPYYGYYYRIRPNSLSRGEISPKAPVDYLRALVRLLERVSVDPHTLTKMVNASFCSCLGRGFGWRVDDCSRETRRLVLKLRRSGAIRLAYVPRTIDRAKWFFFMVTGVFPSAEVFRPIVYRRQD